jgi:hypothetical protein
MLLQFVVTREATLWPRKFQDRNKKLSQDVKDLFFSLEHAGELRIIILRRKRAKSPNLYKITTHTHIHVTSALIVKLEKIDMS